MANRTHVSLSFPSPCLVLLDRPLDFVYDADRYGLASCVSPHTLHPQVWQDYSGSGQRDGVIAGFHVHPLAEEQGEDAASVSRWGSPPAVSFVHSLSAAGVGGARSNPAEDRDRGLVGVFWHLDGVACVSAPVGFGHASAVNAVISALCLCLCLVPQPEFGVHACLCVAVDSTHRLLRTIIALLLTRIRHACVMHASVDSFQRCICKQTRQMTSS